MTIILSGEYREKTSKRFWAKVNKPLNNTSKSCWLWTAHRNKNGYGQFGIKLNDKHIVVLSHRLSWVLEVGYLPPERMICHSCDTPSCVNPAHLWLGTASHNLMDAINKGRFNNTNLTKEQIKQVINRYNAGEKATLLALEYNVTPKFLWDKFRKLRKKQNINIKIDKPRILKHNEVAKLYHNKFLSMDEISKKFGTSKHSIHYILNKPDIIKKFDKPRLPSYHKEAHKIQNQRLNNASGQQMIFDGKIKKDIKCKIL